MPLTDHAAPSPKKQRMYTGSMKEGEPPRTLGAPRFHDAGGGYTTAGGMYVNVETTQLPSPKGELEELINKLDSQRGCLFESSYDFPGRYARWTMGFCNPPLSLESWGRRFEITALNARGKVLLPPVTAALRECVSVLSLDNSDATVVKGQVREADAGFTEEQRSRQHSIFSVVRAISALFHYDHEVQLGLYGSFGYDLTFQFEPVKLKRPRDPKQRDLVLYLPDEILIIDVLSNAAWRLQVGRPPEA